jgi:hypothetical protein
MPAPEILQHFDVWQFEYCRLQYRPLRVSVV